MEPLSGKQVKDIKDLYQSIYKVEESNKEENLDEYINSLTEEEKKNIFQRAFDKFMKGPDYKKKKENVNLTPTTAEIRAKSKTGMSNIPKAEGSNKKLNPDFGMINKQIVNDKGEVVGSKKINPKFDPSAKDTPFKIQQKDVIKDTSMKNEVKPEVKPEVKNEVKPEVKPEVKKMHPIEKKNRARFGDAHVDKLKAKNIDFKAMRKGDMTKDAFIKKYPKSITAQRASGLRDEYEPYDILLDYVLSEGHADTVEEAHYVMTQMDAETIQTIIEKTGVFKDPKLNIKYPDQPKMTEKGQQILPNLPDPTIVRGKKVIHKSKGTPRIFGDPTGKMSDFFRS
jgi:hypothetical protein